MKKSLSLLALAAAASFAGPVKVGVDVLAGYNILALGSTVSKTYNAKPSFGFGVGPTVAYSINEQVAIGGKISFEYDINKREYKLNSDNTRDYTAMNIGFQIAPAYKVNEQISAKLGYEWVMPIGGTQESSNGTTTNKYDVVWAPTKFSDLKEKETPALSTHNIIVGASYTVMPNLSVTLQGKFALTGFVPDYKYQIDGVSGDYIFDDVTTASSSNQIKVHQIAIGVNYNFL